MGRLYFQAKSPGAFLPLNFYKFKGKKLQLIPGLVSAPYNPEPVLCQAFTAELQRRMRDISSKMFTQTARALERDKLIRREIFPVIPPKVEYSLTDLGYTVIPVIMQIGYWGEMISSQQA